jgi:putative ATPase
MTGDLFGRESSGWRPLADRMRPRTLAEVSGQTHLLAPGKPLARMLAGDTLHSAIFWGPPGVGKTTLARLISEVSGAHFIGLSAVMAGVKDIRAAVEQAGSGMRTGGTVLFLDEVHRFNKSQQDAFLPWVEDGTLVFVGATTENPSFALNNALLSRAQTYVLKVLEPADIVQLLQRALNDNERGLGALGITADAAALNQLANAADGDGRRALNLLELAADLAVAANESAPQINEAVLAETLTDTLRRFDRGGDVFYDQISALHKSVRGSDPDASLYWYARMIDGGCDPLYIARRVIRMASEDIGNADPRALQVALDAWECVERLGQPEGELMLAQAIVFLACAAKSNAVYSAWNEALADARRLGSLEVPMHIRNAPTKLMKDLGHGDGYRYAHNEADGFAAGETYFPEGMSPRQYYQPVARGLEIQIGEKLKGLRQQNSSAKPPKPDTSA